MILIKTAIFILGCFVGALAEYSFNIYCIKRVAKTANKKELQALRNAFYKSIKKE